jgi:hypothetical protein
MTRGESGPADRTSRRMFLTDGLLVGASAAVVAITSIPNAGSAQT